MTDRSLDLLIDEVVLGLASDNEIERVERLATGDPDIAARLERARQRFAPLDDTAEVLPVPGDLWERIEERLDAPKDAAVPPPSNVVDMAGMRGTLARWRTTAIGGIAATLALAAVLGWTLMSSPQPRRGRCPAGRSRGGHRPRRKPRRQHDAGHPARKSRYAL